MSESNDMNSISTSTASIPGSSSLSLTYAQQVEVIEFPQLLFLLWVELPRVIFNVKRIFQIGKHQQQQQQIQQQQQQQAAVAAVNAAAAAAAAASMMPRYPQIGTLPMSVTMPPAGGITLMTSMPGAHLLRPTMTLGPHATIMTPTANVGMLRPSPMGFPGRVGVYA